MLCSGSFIHEDDLPLLVSLYLFLEVTCSHPQALYLDYWGDSGQQQRLGDSVSYTCGSDYRSTDGAPWATCTRDGWKPNPLCQGIMRCSLFFFKFCFYFFHFMYLQKYNLKNLVNNCTSFQNLSVNK